MEQTQNTIDKLSIVLTYHFSMYQADMLERAIFDESIDADTFQKGLEDLEKYRATNAEDDEYTPEEFAKC